MWYQPLRHGRPEGAFVAYVLQTGEAGAERLALVEKVYGDHTRRILGQLGVHEGAKVADLGCGAGSTTKWFSSLVGPAGEVVAVDESGEQLALLGHRSWRHR